MIIRVEPDLLKGFASTMHGTGSEVSSLGSSAAAAASSAPSYNGQFGPQVQAIGAETQARVSAFTTHLIDLSEKLGRKAVEFEGADAAALTGFTGAIYKDWAAEQAALLTRWSQLTGIPVATLERYLKLGMIFGGSQFYVLLFAMVMSNSVSSWTGATFSGMQTPTWWPSWLGWPARNAQPTMQAPAPVKSKTGTTFGDLLERQKIIPVPFQSQWNGKDGGGNCGPASVTMAINAFGKNVNYQDVISKMPKNAHGYTDFQSEQVKGLLKDNGLREQQINNVDELAVQINSGHPVIIAVDNSQYVQGSSGPYPATSGYLQPHIVVVTGIERDAAGKIIGVYINDPLAVKPGGPTGMQAAPDIGKNFHVSVDQFLSAAGKNWYAAAIEPTP